MILHKDCVFFCEVLGQGEPCFFSSLIQIQWEFQDPKMDVRWYHVFGHILGIYTPYIGLMYAFFMVGTSNKSVPEMAIDK